MYRVCWSLDSFCSLAYSWSAFVLTAQYKIFPGAFSICRAAFTYASCPSCWAFLTFTGYLGRCACFTYCCFGSLQFLSTIKMCLCGSIKSAVSLALLRLCWLLHSCITHFEYASCIPHLPKLCLQCVRVSVRASVCVAFKWNGENSNALLIASQFDYYILADIRSFLVRELTYITYGRCRVGGARSRNTLQLQPN